MEPDGPLQASGYLFKQETSGVKRKGVFRFENTRRRDGASLCHATTLFYTLYC
jgi:hypothetical protein